MTLSDALRESKARFKAGESEMAGHSPKAVAPSYSRKSSSQYVRWDPTHTYTFGAEDLTADDWERGGLRAGRAGEEP